MVALVSEKRIIKNGLAQYIRKHLAHKIIVPFALRLQNKETLQFGGDDPVFTISINDHRGLMAIIRFDELRFSEAYINGNLDIDGDMWGVVSNRPLLRDIHPLHRYFRRLSPLFTGQLRINKNAITDHYEIDNAFFLKFLDPSRCYSQALFENDNEQLEVAQHRKLDFVLTSCGIKPGDRVLDVGGGWGAFVEHAGKRGVHVTALTLAKQSEQFLKEMVHHEQLPCEVKFGDFYQYESTEPYDAIVILGVMEHLPDYGAVVAQFHRLLKPGGKIYLDASSFREKYSKSTFISRYVFPGNHRYFCLHDFLSRIAQSNLDIRCIYNDRHSYYLTCRAWAKNLESAHEEISERWGERRYRIFRLYLWASAYAFYNRSMDAFRVVLDSPDKNLI